MNEEMNEQKQVPMAWRWSEPNGGMWIGWTTDWGHYERAKELLCLIELAYPAQTGRCAK